MYVFLVEEVVVGDMAVDVGVLDWLVTCLVLVFVVFVCVIGWSRVLLVSVVERVRRARV